MTAIIFSYIFPVMLLTLLLQAGGSLLKIRLQKRMLTIILSVSATIILSIPIGGISLARYMISLEANVSIPMLFLLFHRIWINGGGKEWINPAARFWFFLFAVISGLLLYPAGLGLGPFDPYGLGWGFSPLLIVPMILTILLIFLQQPLGIALLLSILACNLKILESSNLWDYMLDPYFFFLSIGMMAHEGVSKFKSRASSTVQQ